MFGSKSQQWYLWNSSRLFVSCISPFSWTLVKSSQLARLSLQSWIRWKAYVKVRSEMFSTFYRCIKRSKSVVFGNCKYLNSEQQLTHMWFLWSGAESDNCDGKDVCAAIKTLEMKLEAKLKNLYAMVENISMSLQPPPGKLGVKDIIGSSVYHFFVLFCNECFIWL